MIGRVRARARRKQVSRELYPDGPITLKNRVQTLDLAFQHVPTWLAAIERIRHVYSNQGQFLALPWAKFQSKVIKLYQALSSWLGSRGRRETERERKRERERAREREIEGEEEKGSESERERDRGRGRERERGRERARERKIKGEEERWRERESEQERGRGGKMERERERPCIPSGQIWLFPLGSKAGQGERELFIDNLLVRIHFIIEVIWWTGLALWKFEFRFWRGGRDHASRVPRLGMERWPEVCSMQIQVFRVLACAGG